MFFVYGVIPRVIRAGGKYPCDKNNSDRRPIRELASPVTVVIAQGCVTVTDTGEPPLGVQVSVPLCVLLNPPIVQVTTSVVAVFDF